MNFITKTFKKGIKKKNSRERGKIAHQHPMSQNANPRRKLWKKKKKRLKKLLQTITKKHYIKPPNKMPLSTLDIQKPVICIPIHFIKFTPPPSPSIKSKHSLKQRGQNKEMEI